MVLRNSPWCFVPSGVSMKNMIASSQEELCVLASLLSAATAVALLASGCSVLLLLLLYSRVLWHAAHL